MISNIFNHEQIVRFSDTDAAGIVYFGAYATFFDESFIAAMRNQGITWTSHREIGFLMPIVEQNIKFFHPLRAGEKTISHVSIIKMGQRSFRTDHIITIMKNGIEVPVAEGFISRVVVDYNSFKPIKIPPPLKEALRNYTVDKDIWQEFRKSIIND